MVIYFARFTTLIGILLIPLLFKQSKMDDFSYTTRKITLFVFILISAYFMFEFNFLSDVITLIVLAIIFAVYVIYLFITIYRLLSDDIYNIYLYKHVKEHKLYCFIDNKGRIREISKTFCDKLNLSKSNVMGKDFIESINSEWKVSTFNSAKVNKDDLRNHYDDYPRRAKDGLAELRYFTFEKDGRKKQTLTLILTEKPIFLKNKYYARLLVGDDSSGKSHFEQEQDLATMKQRYSILQSKFISIIELSHEYMFVKHQEKDSFWCNINFKNLIGNNEINTMTSYEKLIHPEDVTGYKDTLSRLTQNNPSYDINYRLQIKGRFLFVNECGKKVLDDDFNEELIGYVKPLSVNDFQKTNVSFLDDLQCGEALFERITKYYAADINFELVTFRITNIQEICDRHNRPTANAFMSHYVSQVKNALSIVETDIFRKSDADFVFILMDEDRMYALDKILKKEKNILELYIELGAVSETLDIRLSKVLSINASNSKGLIKNGEKALAYSLDESNKVKYATDKDVM